MNRKDFIKKLASSMLFTVPAVIMLSCSDSNSISGPPITGNGSTKNCLKNGTQSIINSNHGHALTVSKADVDNGKTKQYSIAGAADHDHDVKLSTDNFDALKNNQQIEVTSTSEDGHTHVIVVSCI
jgi:hypothetical protein